MNKKLMFLSVFQAENGRFLLFLVNKTVENRCNNALFDTFLSDFGV